MTEELLEVPKFLKPVKKKAKNGRKKIKIGGPKEKARKINSPEDFKRDFEAIKQVNLIAPYSARYSKLEETLAKIRLREGRSMQLTGDAKLLIEALEHITLLLRQ